MGLLSCLAGAVAAEQGDVAAGAKALPFDLAFDRYEFPLGTGPVPSPDGDKVAFVVRTVTADVDLDVDSRYQPSGTPSLAVGSRIQVVELAGGTSQIVCPDRGSCWRPSWAPDGSRLAFYSDAEGYPQLWLYDFETMRARRVSDARIKAKLWSGDHPRWSPDGGTLYVPLSPNQSVEGDFSTFGGSRDPATAATEGGPDTPTVTVLQSGGETAEATKPEASRRTSFMLFENNAAMAAIAVTSGDVRVLVEAETEPRPSVLRLSPSGRWLSYLSVFKPSAATQQTDLYDLAVVPATSGESMVLARDIPVGRSYHEQNYSWHPSRDELVYLQDDALWHVELGSEGPGEPRRLGAGLGRLAPVPLWFTRDGTAVVVGTRPLDYQDYREERARGLALVPLNGGDPTEVAFGEAWQYQDLLKANETTIWQPEPGTATALLRDVASGESAIIRIVFGNGEGADGRLEVLWKGVARLSRFRGATDHGAIFGLYEDIATPPDVYRFDADFSDRQRLSHIDDRLDDIAKPTVEILEVDAPQFDGAIGSVRTAILLPPGAGKGARLPGVVLLYPGLDVYTDAETFGGGMTVSVPTLLLVSRGYAVILVHLRLGPNAEAGQPLQEMVDVLLPQVYKAAELGYVDVTRLGIAGLSYGGYGTAGILSRTNLFRAAVAISGLYDLGGTYGHLIKGYRGFWVGWAEGGQGRMGTHPWADVRRYIDNSPYYQADKIHTPLLLVHGDEDFAYHDAEKLFTALRRLDRDVQLAIYHGEGHWIPSWSRANAVDASRRIVEFFDTHLPVGSRDGDDH